MIELYNGDCLVEMAKIPDKSVDMILCDLPYGVLNRQNKDAQWDNIIPLQPMWEHYLRVIKDNGAIVLFCQGMFTAQLMMSQPKLWRYNLVWDKIDRVTGFLNASRCPLRIHEDIAVFYKSQPIYNPQMIKGVPNHARGAGNGRRLQSKQEQSRADAMGKSNLTSQTQISGGAKTKEIIPDDAPKNRCYGGFYMTPTKITNEKYPTSIIRIEKEHDGSYYHPTQKPVNLCRYLIRTYTNEGETVLDNTMGSGTTGVACVMEKRNFIGIELNEEYFKIAQRRIEWQEKELTLF